MKLVCKLRLFSVPSCQIDQIDQIDQDQVSLCFFTEMSQYTGLQSQDSLTESRRVSQKQESKITPVDSCRGRRSRKLSPRVFSDWTCCGFMLMRLAVLAPHWLLLSEGAVPPLGGVRQLWSGLSQTDSEAEDRQEVQVTNQKPPERRVKRKYRENTKLSSRLCPLILLQAVLFFNNIYNHLS